jgi:hypothetical protein
VSSQMTTPDDKKMTTQNDNNFRCQLRWYQGENKGENTVYNLYENPDDNKMTTSDNNCRWKAKRQHI